MKWLKKKRMIKILTKMFSLMPYDDAKIYIYEILICHLRKKDCLVLFIFGEIYPDAKII